MYRTRRTSTVLRTLALPQKSYLHRPAPLPSLPHQNNPLTPLPAENQWLHLSLITQLKKSCLEVFPTVEYAYTTIPTYPSGQIGFMVCCKDKDRDVTKPLRSWSREEEEKLCRYYNKEIHSASFVLPSFARVALRLDPQGGIDRR
jgi:hypothetical protein